MRVRGRIHALRVLLIAACIMLMSLPGCFGAGVSSGTQTAEDSRSKQAVSEATAEEIPGETTEEIPEYSGEVSVTLNNNQPQFTDEEMPEESFVQFSELDEFGRCGAAYGLLGIESAPVEERGPIGQVEPSGWHTANYHELVDGNYLYNRCHLIAYQLCGDNTDERNLITGTRWFNVKGMLPYESEIADYIKMSGNHVWYRVTPVFRGENLVADGAIIEAMSAEDAGETLSFCVYVYNVQPGIEIDYRTGDSRVSDNYEQELAQAGILLQQAEDTRQIADPSGESSEASEKEPIPEGVTYIGNANTKKFHDPTCSSVLDMAVHNRVYYYGDRQELIEDGYVPCQNCNP